MIFKPEQEQKLREQCEQRRKEYLKIIRLKNNVDLLLRLNAEKTEIIRAKKNYQRKRQEYIKKWDEIP